jgi:hypothetical protein
MISRYNNTRIMPARLPRYVVQWIWVSLAVALVVAGTMWAPRLQYRLARGWHQYHEPRPAGAEEERVRSLVLSGQPLETRLSVLFQYFVAGFIRHAVPGYARVQYAGAGSRNGYTVDGLEGYARTGSLIAAWVYSGREPLLQSLSPRGSAATDLVAMLRSGLIEGTNPRSPEYWGDFERPDQRMVEAADVARIVWMTRTTIWDKLNDSERRDLRAWLIAAAGLPPPHNNWMLFPVVIDLVLASLPGETQAPLLEQRAHAGFAAYRQLYLDHGWFNDPPHGVDFYNTWGIPYDLFWIRTLAPDFEPQFIGDAIQQSAQLTQHLIGPRGVPILGRSICYRTAVPVPLLAASLLEPEKFPAGEAARALDVVWQYFVANDALRDGALTQGYFKEDLRLLDTYSGTGSCHWGLRSLVLALMHPEGDPFWRNPEQPLPVEVGDYRLELTRLGWIVEGRRETGNITITVLKNATEVNTIEALPWAMSAREFFLRTPLRPGNHEVKYESRHYSSTSPYPLEH